ncbi:MAG: restriction endonuclease subunit S [Petrimonas sp.]|nr:restriction endonuclease subunit S [Petrimonas sp.]
MITQLNTLNLLLNSVTVHLPPQALSLFTWEQRKLSELAAFSKGQGYSKSDLRGTGTPIILYGRLYTKYETVISEVDTFVQAKENSVYSRGGEVVVPASGETAEDIARASVVEKTGILLGGDLNVLQPDPIIAPVFLALTISNGEQQKELAKRAQGKSVVHLHNSDLQEVKISYPSFKEQKRIGAMFLDFDNLITLHQREPFPSIQITKPESDRITISTSLFSSS